MDLDPRRHWQGDHHSEKPHFPHTTDHVRRGGAFLVACSRGCGQDAVFVRPPAREKIRTRERLKRHEPRSEAPLATARRPAGRPWRSLFEIGLGAPARGTRDMVEGGRRAAARRAGCGRRRPRRDLRRALAQLLAGAMRRGQVPGRWRRAVVVDLRSEAARRLLMGFRRLHGRRRRSWALVHAALGEGGHLTCRHF